MRARRLALLFTLSIPLCASGADWVRVGVQDQHEHSYDRSKLLVDGDEITYWRRVLFLVPQQVDSGVARLAMYRERINCNQHTHYTLGYLLYGQDGGIIDNVYTPQASAEPIIPHTVGDRFEALMCTFVEQAKSARAAAEPQTASATPQGVRAEVEQLEARLRELRDELQRIESSPAPGPPATGQP
jgi:hypothetical protein